VNALTGTGRLTRLALRRDRVMVPLWVLGIVVIVLSTASSYRGLYPTVASRRSYAQAVEGTAGLLAITGKPFDLTSIGGMTAWRATAFGALLVGIMSLLLVTRHTRAEEESGRLELISSTVVGRFAPLTAAVLTALTANAAIAGLTALGLISVGEPAGGSIALGLAFAITGVVFTAIAAVTAQLTESARTANGLAAALAGAAYLLRAVGDATSLGWLGWLSPIGWSERLRPYAGERWWIVAVAVAVSGALTGLGYRLAARRDLGAGVLASRPGPARAPGWLRSPLALAWRLQRGSVLGWVLGFAALGAVLGAVTGSVSDFAGNAQLRVLMRSMGGQPGLVDAYLATITTVAGIVTAAYAVQAVLRLPGEENSQRAEALLATSTGRIRWALGHLAVALTGSAVLLLAFGVAAGLTSGGQPGEVALPRVLGAALVQLPAIGVITGLVIALFGWLPRWTPAGWGAVLAVLMLNLIGPLLHLNHWVLDLSPFTHLPSLPGGDLSWVPLAWLLAVALGLSGFGMLGLRRRDIG
jgi:ABC-2 type transport system permease protein